jgi:hypothetical protein
MRPFSVVMLNVLSDELAQVAFAQRDDAALLAVVAKRWTVAPHGKVIARSKFRRFATTANSWCHAARSGDPLSERYVVRRDCVAPVPLPHAPAEAALRSRSARARI